MHDARPGRAAAMLTVNGAPHDWRDGLTLAALLREREDADATVATAVNGGFVPRPARAATTLRPGDSVLVFAAIVGG